MSADRFLKTCIVSLLGVPVLAAAQASSDGDVAAASGGGLEVVVVTAQRREQNLQNVPISIAAVTEETLQAFQITDTVQIQQLVPGLTINKSLLNAVPYLRGVGQSVGSYGVDSPVAGYMDGFYIASPTAAVFSLNNISRVEVLKGPQGTLFGRNATGGVIHVITRDPSVAPALDLTAGYANFDTTTVNLYGETAITDTLAFNVSGLHRDQGEGWGRNLFSGNEAFYTDEAGASAKLMWTPSDSTTVKLLGFYDEIDSDIGVNYGVYPGSVATDGTRNLGRFTVNHIDTPISNEQYLVGLTIEQDLGWSRLVSLTSYQDLDNSFAFVQNAIATGAVNIAADFGTQTRTQELQLLSSADASIDWIVGLFYLDDQQAVDQMICVGLAAACNPPTNPSVLHVTQETTSYAVFGQTSFDIVSDLRATLGLRYTDDEKEISGSQPGAPLPFPGAPYAGNPNGIPTKASWSKLTWRAALDYQFNDDILGYVSYNRGFKSGSYNITAWNNVPSDPEILDAYEVGLKTEWLNSTLRLNSAVFYYDYKDIQLRSAAPPAPPGQFIILNAAESEIYGIDVELLAAPIDRLSIIGGFEVLHAEYSEFSGAPCTTPAPIGGATLGGTISATCDLEGNDLIRSPDFSGTIGFTYELPTAMGDITIGANNSYNSGFYWDPDNRLKHKSYSSLNASLGWQVSDAWRLELWGRNLLDEDVDVSAQGGSGRTDVYSPGEPRTYGVRVNFRLGR